MIAGLKPYAKYKDSGSKWLGLVPDGWQVRSLRSLIGKRAERNRQDLPLLSVAREKGVFVRSLTDADENHNVIPDDLSNYKVARAGNLVINKMKAWQGSMGIAPCDGIVSPAYFVFDLRLANVAFGQRLLCSKPYVAHFAQASDGVRVGQWDLSIPGMREIPVLVPSPNEQATIVRFLNHANRKIDGFIRIKRRLIALLNEQKQAIIHRAVTRGLDPAVPLKPSGIEWLGDIPAHWIACPLKRTLSKIDYGTSEGSTADGRFRVLTMAHVRNGRVFVPESGGIDAIPSGLELKVGDLLFNRTNSPELVGKVGLFSEASAEPVTFASYLVRLRVTSEYNSRWLSYVLNAAGFLAYARSQAFVSLHQANLSSSRYSRMSIPVPPRSEQDVLAEMIQEQTRLMDAAIARTEREIALMQEYRTRLTADVVTGKLDVRAAAASLPEIVDTTADEAVIEETVDELEFEDTE